MDCGINVYETIDSALSVQIPFKKIKYIIKRLSKIQLGKLFGYVNRMLLKEILYNKGGMDWPGYYYFLMPSYRKRLFTLYKSLGFKPNLITNYKYKLITII